MGTAISPRFRKILCIGSLAAVTSGMGVGTAAAQEAPGGAHNLLTAKLSQSGRRVVFTVDTAAAVPLSQMERLPSPKSPDSRYLCLALRKAGGGAERLLCLGGSKNARHRVGLELLNSEGAVTHKETLPAQVERPESLELVAALVPGKAGLSPRRYHWRVLESRGACPSSPDCAETLPPSGSRLFRLRPVRPVGCTGGTAGLVYNGPRSRKIVALTFDDGPSSYTSGFLSVLRHKHVHGTFFEIGQEVAARPSTTRQVLAEGNEVGNHTMHHAFYPGYSDLAVTNALIRRTTHFEPCVFRPPGGGVNSSVVAAAGEAGLKTIIWDVDPTDWANPGSGAVYSRIVGAARPGSIILMHDGGGNRSGTLAALPAIIDTLRARGYRFETVTQLLGGRMIYRPYG